MKTMASIANSAAGSKVFESNFSKKLDDIDKTLEDHFTVSDTVHQGKSHVVVHCHNLKSLVEKVAAERGLTQDEYETKFLIDGGKGFLKAAVSLVPLGRNFLVR